MIRVQFRKYRELEGSVLFFGLWVFCSFLWAQLYLGHRISGEKHTLSALQPKKKSIQRSGIRNTRR